MHFVTVITAFAAAAQAAMKYKGVDWSSTSVSEASGHIWIGLDGNTKPVERIFKSNGVSTVRQRLWVNPEEGNYDIDYNIKLAKRAHAQGLELYLDIHFSDTWADPSHQTTPAAWAGYGIDDLADEVYNYTKSTMDSFQAAGLPLAMVSIGNEITAGMLWPLGDINDGGDAPNNLARLLHSASSGIKDSTIAVQPKIMIHLDNGWKYETQEWWYDTVLGEGPLAASDYDIQGVSYYPFYNEDATLASLKSSLTQMKSKYGKEVMVVETDWPSSCPDPEYAFPSDTKSITFSTGGQSTWIKNVAEAVTAAGGDGLFYWEPFWIDNAALGSSCANNLMVDNNGQAQGSIAVFNEI